ncbi:type II restriction endonuclease [Haloplanus rubicundus]|nr:type II restriction endonuclease [Haloplanus rubicundus]
MDINNEIKNELQGSGFLEEVKETRLPNSTVITGAALEKYESTYASLNPETISRQADRVLKRLLELEHEIYNEREQRVYREALVVFLQEKYDTGQTSLHSFNSSEPEADQFTEYPHLQELFAELEEIYETTDDFKEAFQKILPLLYPAMDAISVSAQQSRRKRAGDSLRSHIENLLGKAGYTIDSVHSAGNGYLYQLHRHETDQEGSVYLSYLTTLRDRFRQSLSNGSIEDEDVPRFIMTGAGNSIFTSSRKSGVTDQKVSEITDEGFTLVVFETVKQNQHPDKKNVISYTEFFAERLPTLVSPE